jgi:hypothetical protein
MAFSGFIKFILFLVNIETINYNFNIIYTIISFICLIFLLIELFKIKSWFILIGPTSALFCSSLIRLLINNISFEHSTFVKVSLSLSLSVSMYTLYKFCGGYKHFGWKWGDYAFALAICLGGGAGQIL